MPQLGKPLYLGEYGPAGMSWGPSPDEGAAYISGVASLHIQLSTLWSPAAAVRLAHPAAPP